MSVFEDSLEGFLGPVWVYLKDPSVSEILVNGPNEIFVEKKGRLERVPSRFIDDNALQAAIRNIAQFVGKKISKEEPILDARLPDGSRIAAVLPPCSRKGSTLSIRKFNAGVPKFEDLLTWNSISLGGIQFLKGIILLRKNILVSGGTGSGKTTLLNILGSAIPDHERTIVIEDSSELQIAAKHVVNLETKPPNDEGEGEIRIRDLIKASLRLRPDRIIVGEVRGAESLDLIAAMSTGHAGSMGTVHANTPKDAFARMETLCLMAESAIPALALRKQIASAVDLIVQMNRLSDGSRKITHISEVVGVDSNGEAIVEDLFRFEQKSIVDGAVIGEMLPSGKFPTFVKEIIANKIPISKSIFERNFEKKVG